MPFGGQQVKGQGHEASHIGAYQTLAYTDNIIRGQQLLYGV